MEAIYSPQNPKIKELVKLHDRRYRYEKGRFLIEGLRELSRAFDKGISIDEVYYSEQDFKGPEFSEFLKQIQEAQIPTFPVTPEVFRKGSHREGPDGLIGVAEHWNLPLTELRLSTNPFLLVVENIEKPGNLGSLIRSAESAGVDGMIVCNPVVDLFNPNVVRNSQGALFSLPITVVDNASALQFLQRNHIQIIATTPHSQILFWDVDMKQPVAILLGSEKDGLSNFWLQNTDLHVKIPQQGKADSLNVNIAASLTLYEALRQRR